jgi:hypothetical protein
MQTFLQRTIWFAIWTATMAITFWLCADMAKDQPILLAIVILCAIAMSVALVYARSHWRDGNLTSAAASLFVGLLCLSVSVVSEIAYWSGSIDGMHEQIQREKALVGGQDLVKERRRKQLAQAVAGKLPAQIEAEIAVAPNRQEANALRAQLKAARELEALQGQVIADSTQTVSYSMKRSLYQAAVWFSENAGGNVRAWIGGIVALIVSCLLSLHLLSLYIGFAPRGARATHTAAKDKTPVTVALTPASPVSAPAKPSSELAKLFQAPDTDPKPPASQPLPESKPVEAEIKPALRLVETQPEPVRPKTRAEREEAIDATTRKWVAACAIPTPVGFATPSAQAYASYRAWCRTHKVEPLNRSWFGRSLARIGITVRKSAQGANYGLQITSEVGRRAAAG